MKSKLPLKQQPRFRLSRFRLFSSKLKGRRSAASRSSKGFTLVELLVAMTISMIVIFVIGAGLVSATNMSRLNQSRIARQSELNLALDFITNEIRMVRSINQSTSSTANGSTVMLSDVVTSAGVNLANLGNYGTLALYLERRIANAPAICPAGGPNAGASPPAPANFDPIVYDVRPSPSGWLQPRMLARYGRVPLADGTINPCSNPVSSDPMIDALPIAMSQTPTCSGLLSGAGGFYSCVNGKKVNLFFQSVVTNNEVKQVSSIAASRLMNFQPATTPTPTSSCSNESSLKSTSSSTSSTINFVNNTANIVKAYWLNAAGTRTYYFDLAPRQSVTQPTFDANPWVITDSSTNCLDIFVANQTASLATIQ